MCRSICQHGICHAYITISKLIGLHRSPPVLISMKLRGAYVTLLTKAPYLPGTLVLDHGLRAVGSQYPLVVMVTSSLSDAAKAVLHNRGIITRKIDSLHPKKGNHALAAHDERFADTWSKLRCALYPIYQKITTDNVGHGNRGFGLTEYDVNSA